MKIGVCHANTHPPTAGIGNFAYNIAKSLNNDGFEFHLFLRGKFRYRKKTEDNLTIHRCPYLKLYPFNNHVHGYFVEKKIRELESDLDVLHLHSPISPPIRTKLPTVATIHTPLQHKQEVTPRSGISNVLYQGQLVFAKRVEKSIIENADTLTTVSESVRKDICDYGIDREDIIVTPNGVDTSEFGNNIGSDSGTKLLYTGRLAPEKGLPDLLKAMSKLNPNYNAELTITGTGSYENVLKQQCRELGIENNVNFTGFVSREELISIYESSDIFVFPTYYEGLPTSVLEAMAAGLPIVSTHAPGVRDLIDDGNTGLLSSPGEVNQLKKNIEDMLSRPDMRDRLGAAAKKEAELKYDWKIVSQQMKSVYQQVSKN